jgi:hypothetical protein
LLDDRWSGGATPALVVEDAHAVALERPARPGSVRSTKHDQAFLLWGALALGAVLRVLYYLGGRSLWIDEARLALNVGTRGYGALLQPLDYDQAASPLFLWGEKLATQLFGMNERALWLLPLLTGLAAMVLLVPLARRFLPGWTGVIACASFCIAPTLIHFSANAKPYIGDLAFALLILVGVCCWIERPMSRMARALPLIGAIAAWASTPAIFTLLPAGGAMVLAAGRERRTRAALVVAFWLASFAVAYALVYGPSAHNAYLQRFWQYQFLLPWEPGFVNRLGAARRDILTAFSIGLYVPPTSPLLLPPWFLQVERWVSWVFAAVATVGAIALIRSRSRWESVLLFGPVVLLAAASALGRYPASARLVLFVMPVFYLSVAAGASVILAVVGSERRQFVAGALVGPLLGLQGAMALRYLRDCPAIENTRGMVALLGPVAGGPQVVYVQAGALPAWAFYSTDWRRPNFVRLARYAALGASDGGSFENAYSRGRVAPGEGWDLQLTSGNRLELAGVPAGVWHRPRVPGAGKVDVGWVDNEIGRMRRAAGCRGVAWVLTSHSTGADSVLIAGLRAAGDRATFAVGGLGANLSRFELEPPEGVCPIR